MVEGRNLMTATPPAAPKASTSGPALVAVTSASEQEKALILQFLQQHANGVCGIAGYSCCG